MTRATLSRTKVGLRPMGSDLQEAVLVPLGMDRRRAAFGAAILLAGLLDGEARAALEIIGSCSTRSHECRTSDTVSWWTWLSSRRLFWRNFKSANHVHLFQDITCSARKSLFFSARNVSGVTACGSNPKAVNAATILPAFSLFRAIQTSMSPVVRRIAVMADREPADQQVVNLRPVQRSQELLEFGR